MVLLGRQTGAYPEARAGLLRTSSRLPPATLADPAAMPMTTVPRAAVVAAAVPSHVLDGALVLGVAAQSIPSARTGRGLCHSDRHDNGRAGADKGQQ
jgi:hypothetical protein